MSDTAERIRKGKDQIKALKKQVEALKAKLQDGGLAAIAAGTSGIADAGRLTDLTPVGGPLTKRRVLKGHFGKVYAMQWSGDGTHLCSASQDGKLNRWNSLSGLKTHSVPLKAPWVMTCGVEQAQGKFVATGGLDNIVTVHDITAPGVQDPGARAGVATKHEMNGHDGYISYCRFIDEGNLLSCSGDSTCKLWDVESGTCKETFDGHKGDVMGVSISPTDPKIFVSGSVDLSAKVWDLRTSSCVTTFVGHESDINSVAFMSDGQCFGTGSDDATCRLFDLRSCSELNMMDSVDVLCSVVSVAFSRSGRILFAGYDDTTCMAWDTLAPRPEGAAAAGAPSNLLYTLNDHKARVSSVGVNSTGQALCTASWDTTLGIWA